MWKTVVRRLLIMLPQLVIISFVMFLLALAMPGDALTGMIDPNLTDQDLAAMRALLGLDLPWYTRYWRWISGIIFEFDFGSSTSHFLPVTTVIGQRMSNTFWLSLFTLILTYFIAIPSGIAAGRWKNSPLDKGIMFYTFIALALPTIVMGIIMIFVFSFGLGWFPAGGSVSPVIMATGYWWDILISRIYYMILPGVTGALLGTIGIIYMLRANIIDRAYSEYVVLARSKGVPQKTLFNRHILRNSLVPIASGAGFLIIALLAGSIFVEQIFAYPGMGTLFISSIQQRDFAVANTLILLFAFLTAIGVLVSDIILTVVDPRIRIK